MQHLQNQHVLILGLGISGLSMARWCARCGAEVTVADTREAPPQLDALRAEVPAARFVSGPMQAALVEGTPIRAVFKSPGLTPELVAPVMTAARAQGLLTGGELTLFAQALADLQAGQGYAPAVLAVTGTNGKTTVTSLTGKLVERAGKAVAVAGNIGPALLDTLAERLDGNALPQVWVVELSSFQLDDPAPFEPLAATVLNLTQDHLDWHGSMAAYGAAKARIFGQNAVMVLNRDDPLVMQMLPAPVRLKGGRYEQRDHITFGADLPTRPGDYGIEVVNGMAWLVRAMEADETRRKKRRSPSAAAAAAAAAQGTASATPAAVQAAVSGNPAAPVGDDARNDPGDETREDAAGLPADTPAPAAAFVPAPVDSFARPPLADDDEEELFLQRLMPADALRIRGRHNAVNALASLALAHVAGCAIGPMLYGLRDYRGEPHRVESVGIIQGVEYFDDSKGTNVGATVAALAGLGAERRVVVILGGDGKGQDFSPLAAPVSRFARAAVLIGRDGPLIREALADAGVPLLDAASMEEAVSVATQRAHAGDAVLMSPACASFDMFRNYPHRAEVFVAAVKALADDAGAMLEGSE
jgi:UDP-N-acetylmuramoylalanine--D-glutamate ligase